MNGRTRFAGVVASAVTAASALAQQPVFKARLDLVSVNVSVKRGNTPVTGLATADFRLFDNGILQTVEEVTVEAVPIDLTLFFDTSPSFIGNLDDLKDDLRKIAALLGRDDRIRLLAFATEIEEVMPWTSAGETPDVSALRVGEISPVYDGLAASLLHRPDLDRRHLIVAMTDGLDYNSAVSSLRLLDMSARSEAMLHLVLLRSAGSRTGPRYQLSVMMRGPDVRGFERLQAAAERTGGSVQMPLPDENIVNTFKKVFSDFKTSYVLRFAPTGVPAPGWHDLKVEVPSVSRATIRARRGYSQ
jgi:VWFA-related protein